MFSPADIGLPPKFTAYRRGQGKLALSLAESSTRFNLLQAPTGCGKSVIAATLGQLRSGRWLALTRTKALQAQLMRDFGAMGLADIRGRANYICLHRDYTDCAEPTALEERCSYTEVDAADPYSPYCPHSRATRVARDASSTVSNYSYWMSLAKYGNPLAIGSFDTLVCDEGHNTLDAITDFCAIEIDGRETHALLKLDAPDTADDIELVVAWAKRTLPLARQAYRDTPERDRKRLVRLTALGKAIAEIVKLEPDLLASTESNTWVVEPMEHRKQKVGIHLVPVWPGAYAEQYLFRGVPYVLLCSATLYPETARHLGIARDQYTYTEVDSPFHPSHRPFIYVPTVRVDYRMSQGQLQLLLSRIDEIISTRLDRKGAIHTRSFERMRQVLGASKYASIMTNDLEHHARTSAPSILIGPNFEEGLDLADDLCRYQIIPKVPFIYGKNPLIQARKRDDKSYVNNLAAMTLEQMTGRGCRSVVDRCETFMLDMHFGEWFSSSARFTKSFRTSWRTAAQVPPPMVLA